MLPVVPMFHANAWGLALRRPLAGGAGVPRPEPVPDGDPGAHQAATRHGRRRRPHHLDGCFASLDEPRPVRFADDPLRRLGRAEVAVGSLPRRVGLPDPARLGHDRDQPDRHDRPARAATTPTLDEGQRADTRARQGQPVPLVDLRIVDPGGGEAQPWDDDRHRRGAGRGPVDRNEYYRGEGGGAQFTDDGWLRTGDVAAVDPYGNFRLVDRTKDLIKSGGEWIGSVELENEIMAHPKIAEAAVIAVPSEKWVERPLACVVVKRGRGAHGRRGPRAPAAAGGEVVAARRRRVHRRGAEDERGQVLEEDAPRQVHRVPGVQLTRPKRAFTSGNSSGRPPRPLWVSGVGRRSVGVSAEQ